MAATSTAYPRLQEWWRDRSEETSCAASGLALGFLAALSITLLKTMFAAVIGGATPFLFYSVAVMVAAWRGGVTAGLVVGLASAALGGFLFIEPVRRFVKPGAGLLRTAAFLVESGAIAAFTARLQRDPGGSPRRSPVARLARGPRARRAVDQATLVREATAARAEAESASRAKDEFLALLGHELRNPLAPIVTALDLMRERDDGLFHLERTVIERQVNHLVRLVDDLLDVSRITRGGVTLRRRRVALPEVVARALEMASPLLERRAHHLREELEPGLCVDGDPLRLAQVLANLLTNAARFTPPGGHIALRAACSGGEVCLAVRDDGVGIGPELLPRVFDLFSQERQSLDRARGGLGLGLAIVKSLVALHGGRVEVYSEGAGRGSEFQVFLPSLPPEAEATSPSSDPRPRPRGRCRVLVVDDNVDALETLALALSILGYQTERAADGPAALALAERSPPEVALLDIGLPVMDGYELARRFRASPRLAEVRLVAVTGYGQAADRQRSASAGFDAHLVKPVAVELVHDTIAGLLGPGCDPPPAARPA